jgi:hypothetical protein
MHELPDYYALFIGILAAGQALQRLRSYWQAPQNRARRRLRRAPGHSIATFPEGCEGRVTGRVVAAGATTQAPFTNRACVAYEARVFAMDRGRKWRLILEESDEVPFLVEAEGRRALVRASSPRLLLNVDHEDQCDALCLPCARVAAFCEERGEPCVGRTLRIEEAILRAGERVAVLGTGRYEPDPDVTQRAVAYREATRQLILAESGDEPMIVSQET